MVVGRAGIGLDNVDVDAATRRGVMVVNAPQSNIVSAAEHTMALLLSLARKIPQAHSSLTAHKWERSRFNGVEVEHMGRIAERDTRLLTLSVLNGLLAGRTEEEVNLVNAPSLAEERGIQVSERREVIARDFADLIRITIVSGEERVRVVGTTLGHRHRPLLLEAWGQRFNVQIDEPHLALFRYSDVPGLVGHVGSTLGDRGINISAAAVGRHDEGGGDDLAVMAVTTDMVVPDSVVAEIATSDGFVAGRAISFE
jgi:D-3-phosphoglycerate dehydrogenase